MTAPTDESLTAERMLTAYLARWPLLTESEARRELGLRDERGRPTDLRNRSASTPDPTR